MNLSEIKNQIKKLISNGKTKEAIKFSLENLGNNNEDLHNKLYLLLNQNSKLEENDLLGLGKNVEAENRITVALLEIIENLEVHNTLASKSHSSKLKPSYILYSIIVVALIFAIAMFLRNNGSDSKKAKSNNNETNSEVVVEKDSKPKPKTIDRSIFPLTFEYFVGDFTGGNLTIGNSTEHIVLIKNLKVIWDYEECPSFKAPIIAHVIQEYKYELALTKQKGEKIIDRRQFKYSKGDVEKFNINIEYPDTGVYSIWISFKYQIFGSSNWQDFKSQKDVVEKCAKYQ